MKLRARPPRAQPETVVALIDVVFFLLVFFMMVGRMDATAPFEVLPPSAVTGSEMPGGGATVSIAEDGTIAMDGRVLDAPGLVEIIAAKLAVTPDLLVRINAHRATDLRHILPLVARIEAVAAGDVVLVIMSGGG